MNEIKGITNGERIRLSRSFGTAADVYAADTRAISGVIGPEKAAIIAKAGLAAGDIEGNGPLAEQYKRLEASGITFRSIEHIRYPGRLREIVSAPYGIFTIGALPDEKAPTVAIVGSRRATAYGSGVARELGRALGALNIPVISGMARGIDSITQESVLEAGGYTMAVLGNGVDICYPGEKVGLYRNLRREGCLLSELSPGTRPNPRFFPARNRIISGLADKVVVIEAGKKSGSLITADMALDQGRDVFAVPGRVMDVQSAGCNKLIQEGADVFTSVDYFLETLRISASVRCQNPPLEKKILAPDEDLVYACLDLYAKNLTKLEEETGRGAVELTRVLTMLELKGLAVQTVKGYYIRS